MRKLRFIEVRELAQIAQQVSKMGSGVQDFDLGACTAIPQGCTTLLFGAGHCF